MRFGLILGVAAALSAVGCIAPSYEEWRVQRRGVQYPAVVERDADGTEREVIYVPQGNTQFHIDYYDPYPQYYVPGYVTYYTPAPYAGGTYYGGYPAYGYPGVPYGTPYPTNDRGPVYVGPGYAGGAFVPGYAQQPAATGAGSRYYPGSGAWTQPGESRESYGIYGNGNRR